MVWGKYTRRQLEPASIWRQALQQRRRTHWLPVRRYGEQASDGYRPPRGPDMQYVRQLHDQLGLSVEEQMAGGTLTATQYFTEEVMRLDEILGSCGARVWFPSRPAIRR